MLKNLSDNIKSLATIIIIVCTYGMLILILMLCYTDKATVSQVLLAVVSGFTGVTGYYYGYSQGAAKKDEAQASQLANSSQLTVTSDPVK